MATIVRKSKGNVTRRDVDSKTLFQSWHGIPVVREKQAIPIPIVTTDQYKAFKRPLTQTMRNNLFTYFDKMQATTHYPHCIDCKTQDKCLHYISKTDIHDAVYIDMKEFYCINCNKKVTGKRFTFIKQCAYCKSFALGKRYHTIVDYYVSNYKRYRINLKKNTVTIQIEVNNGINNIGWKSTITGMITRNWR